MQWILSRNQVHGGNINRYFQLLDEFYHLCFEMEEQLIKLNFSIDAI